jgi:RNA polymerase sigma-70 factor (ECF subfamily)
VTPARASPSRPDAEAGLVARARAGDHDAYGMLVQRHQELAFRTAYVVCGHAADAEDAAQEAFMKAHRALPRFRPEAPFRPWLLQIVANEARNRRRSAGRRRHLVARAAALAGTAAEEAGPESAVLDRLRHDDLTAALRRLDPAHRQVLVLRYLVGLSEAECAAVLDCRPGTVKSRHARALRRLREELADA